MKVHTPLLPLFVATPEYVWFPDYALPFPAHMKDHLLAVEPLSPPKSSSHEELRREGFREGWIATPKSSLFTSTCAHLRGRAPVRPAVPGAL